jgi:predicted dehydrogenase
MNNIKTAGVIECGVKGETYIKDRIGNNNGYFLKKIMIKDKSNAAITKAHYPAAELVEDIDAILHDDTIELVLVTAPAENDKDIISKVLLTGKHVRII